MRLLEAHGIQRLVDVRSIPRSRYNPQFEQSALLLSMPEHGVDYIHLKALGGLRHGTKDSPNTGWRNASFRCYADYMLTPAFDEGVEELLRLAEQKRTAIMCAEAVPWRCHRSLIGDALLVRGVKVLDIMDERTARPHEMTSFAVADGTRLTYPEEAHDG